MKPKTEPSLIELRQEIEELKKQKERKLQIATSMTEKNKLLREINELNAVKKSPSALKKFGMTFGKGLSMVGKTFWKGISSTSQNLNKSSPEFRKFSKTMVSQPKYSSRPPLDIDMYAPRQPSKSKKRKQKARRMVYQKPVWGLD